MMQRRDVLKIGTAAIAWAAVPAALRATASPPVIGLVVDRRFAEALRTPTPTGAWRHVTDGDVTGLWYDRLDHAWRSPGAAIMGLTGDDALFVLERLAWDRGRRVAAREPVPTAATAAVQLLRWTIASRHAF